ncbi:amino acid ABC transporter permease [Aminobacter ciceronei]|uniref:Polar amino acid transport system permease protein n=1 Tax=Aminobacter ciceronei TaxID=150723 RepID=A0ABR6CFB3_9HYPH|nr:amino acid ABC transporter permease [Aminobacter ciceronei]MBA8909938.1 polar amino acid transport system permease protein [Aminobacter ciceronei]MBA9023710.1 polar amino acid transport system permease protein [Aminobacter ciceronei]
MNTISATKPTGAPISASPYVVAKHIPYARYVISAALIVALALIAHAFAVGQIQWLVVRQYLFDSAIMNGMINTIILTFFSMVAGIALGLASALMTDSQNPLMRSVSSGYRFFFRSIPILLQLLIWYNLALVFPRIVVPGIASFETTQVITPFVAALLAFGISQGAYTSEVIRSGLLSVGRGQVEAAKSIGMTRGATLRRIVLPQAMRVIVPPLGNETIGMLKYTSLASIIQYQDIVYSTQTIYYANGLVIEMLIVCAFWYLLVVATLSYFQSKIEKHYNKSNQTHSSRVENSVEKAG